MWDLLLNAIASGLLLGGFYAAVTVGIAISFGMLDIGNLAHPAFIILGSFTAYILNSQVRHRPDRRRNHRAAGVPRARRAHLRDLLLVVRAARRGGLARPRLLLRPAVHHRGGAHPHLRRRLPLRRGAPISGRASISALVDLPLRMLVPCLVSLTMVAILQLFLSRTFIGRAILAVSQDALALRLMAVNPTQVKRVAFSISIATAALAGSCLIIIQPVEPSIGRDYIGRVFAVVRAGRHGQLSRHADGGDAAGRGREPHRDLLRAVLVAGGGVRIPAADAGASARPASWDASVKTRTFWLLDGRRRRRGLRAVAPRHQRLFLLRRLSRAAIHRAGDRVEHPRRLYRLREFRHRRRSSRSAPIRAVVLHKLWGPPIPVSILVGGIVSGAARARHGLSHLAPEGRVLRHRDPGARHRAADPHHQLGLCRRLARRLHHPAGAGAAHRQLHPVSLPGHAGAVGISVAIARTIEHSTLGFGLATDPRRRAVGRSVGRADPAPEADLDHAVAARSWAWRGRRCPIT